MDDSESIQDYYLRVMTIVNQVCGLDHKLGEDEVVSKMVRSKAQKFNFIAIAIKESKEGKSRCGEAW